MRTWSLKRQGEYQCPRCGGISNIFLSPLVYVFALLAVFSSGAVYFFHKFVLDDVDLTTCLQVAAPFGVFFLLSLFLVYLAKPVMKQAPREKRKRGRAARQEAAAPARPARSYDDQEGFTPVRPAQEPAPRADGPEESPLAQELPARSPSDQRRQAAQQAAAQSAVRRTGAPSQEIRQRVASNTQPQQPVRRADHAPSQAPQRAAAAPQSQARQPVSSQAQPAAPLPARRANPSPRPQPQAAAPVRRSRLEEPRPASHVVSSVELPLGNEDYFKKYDDPAYVERRLRELEQGKKS